MNNKTLIEKLEFILEGDKPKKNKLPSGRRPDVPYSYSQDLNTDDSDWEGIKPEDPGQRHGHSAAHTAMLRRTGQVRGYELKRAAPRTDPKPSLLARIKARLTRKTK